MQSDLADVINDLGGKEIALFHLAVLTASLGIALLTLSKTRHAGSLEGVERT